jgi:hypothetical protein
MINLMVLMFWVYMVSFKFYQKTEAGSPDDKSKY